MEKGDYIGKYKVICTLGKGGSGTVYLAEDPILEKLWAIKAVPKKEKKRWQEALIMKNLDHPGLPRITGQMEDEEYYYLVMDYIDGQTLYEKCKVYAVTKEDVVNWGIQICDVLEYLHSRKPPIIYRDLKPGNLMLTADGRIKLIDFGTARNLNGEEMDALGTKGFAAPEQYDGIASMQSDIYNLGACLKWLYRGEKILELEMIFHKCMMENPKLRYQNIRIVREKLLKLKTKWKKRKKERKILLFCLLAVFLLGAGEIIREGIVGYQNPLFISLSGEKEVEIGSVLVNEKKVFYRNVENGIYISSNYFESGVNEIRIEILDEENSYYVTHEFFFE